jgi:hypothetical protein
VEVEDHDATPSPGGAERPQRAAGAAVTEAITRTRRPLPSRAQPAVVLVCPAGQVAVRASGSMTKSVLVNLPVAAGGWVLAVTLAPAASTATRVSPSP